jgi:hypothetical protein
MRETSRISAPPLHPPGNDFPSGVPIWAKEGIRVAPPSGQVRPQYGGRPNGLQGGLVPTAIRVGGLTGRNLRPVHRRVESNDVADPVFFN